MKSGIALVLLICAGCATSYGPASSSIAGGYKETQVAETRFLVTFVANGFTEVEDVQDFLYYRCAELTLQKGFDYFVLVDKNTDLRTQGKIIKPEMRATIDLGRGQLPAGVKDAYDARQLVRFVGPKIGQPSVAPARPAQPVSPDFVHLTTNAGEISGCREVGPSHVRILLNSAAQVTVGASQGARELTSQNGGDTLFIVPVDERVAEGTGYRCGQ